MRPVTFTLRRMVFFSFLIVLSAPCFAQDKHLTNPNADQLAFVDMNDNKGTFFLSANRLNTNKSNTANQNLFRNSWLAGVVQFKTGKQYRGGLLKFDVANNQLFFNNEGRPNIFAEPVSGFTLSDTTDGQMSVARFNNGYPGFGKQTSATFYQVLAYGKRAHLIKYFSKYVVENQGFNTMTTFNYKIIEDYFVYNVASGEMKLMKKSPASFQKALPAFEVQVSKMNIPKKLSEGDMIDLVDAINQL